MTLPEGYDKPRSNKKIKTALLAVGIIGAVFGAVFLQLAIGSLIGYTDPFAVNP